MKILLLLVCAIAVWAATPRGGTWKLMQPADGLTAPARQLYCKRVN